MARNLTARPNHNLRRVFWRRVRPSLQTSRAENAACIRNGKGGTSLRGAAAGALQSGSTSTGSCGGSGRMHNCVCAAFEALRQQAEDGTNPKLQREFLVSTSLVVRGSTAKPGAA